MVLQQADLVDHEQMERWLKSASHWEQRLGDKKRSSGFCRASPTIMVGASKVEVLP